jgi:hypothetical protein
MDLLHNAQQKKPAKYSEVVRKVEIGASDAGEPQNAGSREELGGNGLDENKELKLKKLLFLCIVIFSGISLCSTFFMVFSLTRELNKETVLLVSKLDSIEHSLSKTDVLGSGLKMELERAKINIGKDNQALRDLKENLDAQGLAIEVLSKAKNNLFKRVSELEAAKQN